jgi:type I site-specific restriction endonuclease
VEPFDFGNVIFSYSRKQAIEDGVLVDLSKLCPEECALYKHNVCCTAEVWSIIDRAVKNKKHLNDLKGVVWDVIFMSTRLVIREVDETTRLFQVIIKGAGPQSTYTFKIVCGPGDTAEPVLTIMLPEED